MKQYNTRYNTDVRTTTADAQYDKRGSDNIATEELLSLGAELIASGKTRECTASYVIFDRQKASRLLELRGKIQFADDYDYKAMREGV